jgi:uncharacterized RDD family membrane protein YckC
MASSGDPAPADRPTTATHLPGTPATFGRRLAALAVDWALSFLVAQLITQDAPPPGLWISAVFFFEYTFFTGLFGQTPGMRLLGLACVRVEDGRPLGIPRAAVRAFLLNLVIPAVVFDKDGRGLHDRVARSVVIRG